MSIPVGTPSARPSTDVPHCGPGLGRVAGEEPGSAETAARPVRGEHRAQVRG